MIKFILNVLDFLFFSDSEEESGYPTTSIEPAIDADGKEFIRTTIKESE